MPVVHSSGDVPKLNKSPSLDVKSSKQPVTKFNYLVGFHFKSLIQLITLPNNRRCLLRVAICMKI